MDEELRAMIERGEAMVEAEYETQAEERMEHNRHGINFEEAREQFELDESEELLPALPPVEENELIVF
jgi:hypothetical protein